MKLGERLLGYRARNRVSQTKMDELLDEPINTTFYIENEKYKTQKAKELRILNKITELEKKENG